MVKKRGLKMDFGGELEASSRSNLWAVDSSRQSGNSVAGCIIQLVRFNSGHLLST